MVSRLVQRREASMSSRTTMLLLHATSLCMARIWKDLQMQAQSACKFHSQTLDHHIGLQAVGQAPSHNFDTVISDVLDLGFDARASTAATFLAVFAILQPAAPFRRVAMR